MKNITRALSEDAATILELQKLAYQSPAKLYNDYNIPPLMQTIGELKSEFAYKVFMIFRSEEINKNLSFVFMEKHK